MRKALRGCPPTGNPGKRRCSTCTRTTNVTVGASKDDTLDFGASHRGYTPMTFYGEDCGLVVVSDTEVGLFWAFDDV